MSNALPSSSMMAVLFPYKVSNFIVSGETEKPVRGKSQGKISISTNRLKTCSKHRKMKL